jgi:CRP-like cAMP-binding protein
MIDELKNTYIFTQLNNEQLDTIIDKSRTIFLKDGEPLFEVGDLATHFYLVRSGQIKLTRTSIEGDEKVIEVVRPGLTFAEALMFAEQPNYPVRASAIGKTEIMAFESQNFLKLLRSSVDTCFRVMADMSLRLRRMVKEIDDLTLQTATGRVAGFLCGKYTFNNEKVVAFNLETPKGVLASRLSVKPETFSRILNNFSSQGLVKVQGGHIEILNPKGLMAHAKSAGICGHNLGPDKKIHND